MGSKGAKGWYVVTNIYPCPACRDLRSYVKDSRMRWNRADGTPIRYRRRKCVKCGYKFSTFEMVVTKAREFKMDRKQPEGRV